jgi:16S rRNA (uracil1498-N3)-methyltransferase
MQQDRIYIEAGITRDQPLTLPEPQSHRLARVLRARIGQVIQLFNGTGGYFHAEIVAVNKRSVAVIPRAYVPDGPAAAFRIHLAQGISRGRHMDYTIQKAVELGVTRLIPLITEHSNVQLPADRADVKLAHWRGIVIGACEQCGVNVPPEIVSPVAYDDWIAATASTPRIILDPAASATLTSLALRPVELTLISGPEGGFSEREIAAAVEHHCLPVKIGPRILRTETAAIAAISACQVLWGDLG